MALDSLGGLGGLRGLGGLGRLGGHKTGNEQALEEEEDDDWGLGDLGAKSQLASVTDWVG